jgi:predicted trehalose synthase
MANPNTASGKLLSFPVLKQNLESPVENWIHRLVETKDNLVSALELLRVSYNAMQAGKPILEAEKILEQVEAILKHAEKVKGTAVPTATEVHGSSLQPAKQNPLLLFPTI